MHDTSPQAFLSIDLHRHYLKTVDFVDPQEVLLFLMSDQGGTLDFRRCNESQVKSEVLCCCGQCPNASTFRA